MTTHPRIIVIIISIPTAPKDSLIIVGSPPIIQGRNGTLVIMVPTITLIMVLVGIMAIINFGARSISPVLVKSPRTFMSIIILAHRKFKAASIKSASRTVVLCLGTPGSLSPPSQAPSVEPSQVHHIILVMHASRPAVTSVATSGGIASGIVEKTGAAYIQACLQQRRT